MAYLGAGFGLGFLAAAFAFANGAGLAMVALAYIGGGSAVLVAGLVSAMIFEYVPGEADEAVELLSQR